MQGDAISLADPRVLRDLWAAKWGDAEVSLDTRKYGELHTWFAIASRLRDTGWIYRRADGQRLVYRLREAACSGKPHPK